MVMMLILSPIPILWTIRLLDQTIPMQKPTCHQMIASQMVSRNLLMTNVLVIMMSRSTAPIHHSTVGGPAQATMTRTCQRIPARNLCWTSRNAAGMPEITRNLSLKMILHPSNYLRCSRRRKPLLTHTMLYSNGTRGTLLPVID